MTTIQTSKTKSSSNNSSLKSLGPTIFKKQNPSITETKAQCPSKEEEARALEKTQREVPTSINPLILCKNRSLRQRRHRSTSRNQVTSPTTKMRKKSSPQKSTPLDLPCRRTTSSNQKQKGALDSQTRRKVPSLDRSQSKALVAVKALMSENSSSKLSPSLT